VIQLGRLAESRPRGAFKRLLLPNAAQQKPLCVRTAIVDVPGRLRTRGGAGPVTLAMRKRCVGETASRVSVGPTESPGMAYLCMNARARFDTSARCDCVGSALSGGGLDPGDFLLDFFDPNVLAGEHSVELISRRSMQILPSRVQGHRATQEGIEPKGL